MASDAYLALDRIYSAHNYHPLGVVATRAEGSWIYDVDGNRYLDMLSAYSALNFGHQNSRLTEVAIRQIERLSLTSRAIHNDQLGLFCLELAELVGMEAVLPMNTGAEAVETALKLARKWGYEVKGVAPDSAEIIVMDNNFHGRTISIISFSSDKTAYGGFGPLTLGFKSVKYGDADALKNAINKNTVAVLIEPIQGEAGVIIPPQGYLRNVSRICSERNVLFMADEIQSGLGRTGYTIACFAEDVTPDVLILGKALGGGIVPLSAVVTRWDVMNVIRPGEHGSTFGGNPLACAIGREVVALLKTGEIQARTKRLSVHLKLELDKMRRRHHVTSDIRVCGLWAGIDLSHRSVTGRDFAELLLERGVIAKDTHGNTIRFAPPLTISYGDLFWGLRQIDEVMKRIKKI